MSARVAVLVALLLLNLARLHASSCDDLDLDDAETLTCQCEPLQDDDSTSLRCFSCTSSQRTEDVYTELRLHHSLKEPWRTQEHSNNSKSLYCVEVKHFNLHRAKMRLKMEQIACTVGYEVQQMFAVAQERLDVTRPLRRIYNLDEITVYLYFRKNVLPTINHNESYWEPSVPEHSRLGSVAVSHVASVPQFGRSQGRNVTFDVFRRWSDAQLGNLSELHIEIKDLFHVRGDDVACMPRLTRLTITNCKMRHFSAALSLLSARVNLLAMLRTPAYRHTNCQPETNSTDVDKVLQKFDRCRNINETHARNQWTWQCGSSGVAALKYLNLSHNVLSQLTIEVSAFPNLETVDLSRNKLTAVPKSIEHLIKLRSLNLAWNYIIVLHEIYFARHKLEYLDLSYNQVSSWSNVQIFHSKWHHVKFVNLSHNAITVLSSEMLQSLSDEVSFDLTENPFDCNDCSLLEVKSWLPTHANIGNDLRCMTPKHQGVLLTAIDLMHCSMQDKIYYQVAASVLGVPLVVIVLLFIVFAVRFRFQVNYVWHLVQMRRRAKHETTSQQRQRRNDFEYDAFVSYSGADRRWVHDVLVESLESSEHGYALCLHERDFRLGAYIIDNVAQSMESSRHVILVLSPNFIASKWCQWETKLVQQLMFEQQTEDFLVLVELERLTRDKLPSTLRLLMSTRTYLEWNGEQQVFLQRLSNALGKPLALTQPEVSLRFCAKSAELRYSTNTDASLRYSSESSDDLENPDL